MPPSICGENCKTCPRANFCPGCAETNGKPFGGACMLAECSKAKGVDGCNSCTEPDCSLKRALIEEFNALDIVDMKKADHLNALSGSFINLEYTLANGQRIKLLDDRKIYLGNQLCKENSRRCYGLAADETYLLVCEYGENGSDPEIVVFKRRDKGEPR